MQIDVVVSWDVRPAAEDASYVIFQDGVQVGEVPVGGGELTLANIGAGASYLFEVAAKNALLGLGPKSDPVTVVVPLAPGKVVNVKVQVKVAIA